MKGPKKISLDEWKELAADNLIRRRLLGPNDDGEVVGCAIRGARFDMSSDKQGNARPVYLFRSAWPWGFEPFYVARNKHGALQIVEFSDEA